MADPRLAVIPPGANDAGSRPVLYYDLGSAECYLAAEWAVGALAVVPEWQPVDGAALAGGTLPTVDREITEQRATELGLQAMRWPATLPPRSRRAMLAATYAREIGRVVAFSMAAFRQAFAGGRDLAEDDTLAIAGAACEIHPTALLRALDREAIARSLDTATEAARAAGVRSVPALAAGDSVWHGEAGIGAGAVAAGMAR